MLDVPPDITLQDGRPAYSPRQAGLAASVNAVTIKRLFDKGELAGEKIPSRGKKEFYAIYVDSLEALVARRRHRSLRYAPAVDDLDDVMGLLRTTQTHSRIAELESRVALLEVELLHSRQELEKALARSARLAAALKLQAEQLRDAHTAHIEVQQLLLE